MLTTKERIHELNHRVGKFRRQKSLYLTKLSCAMLCVGLFCMESLLCGSEFHQASIPEIYGSALLFENAGAYVLVSVATFVLGTSGTLMCLHKKTQQGDNIK